MDQTRGRVTKDGIRIYEDADFAGMALGCFNPLGCRTGMQSIRVVEHNFHFRIGWPGNSSGGRHIGGISQRGNDAVSVCASD